MTSKATQEQLEPLMSVKDLASFCGVPVATVYQWLHKRTGPRSYLVGRHKRFKRTEVLAWLDSRAEQ